MRSGLALLLLLLLLPPGAQATEVAGRVVTGDRSLAGARVAVFQDVDFSAAPALQTVTSDADGGFRFDLPPGHYAFYAWGEDEGVFAFCGRNPVAVGNNPVWIGLQAVPVSAARSAPYDDEYSGAVEGRVLFDGEPLPGAHVYLYLDSAEDLKGQGYRMSPPTGEDGFFAFDALPESRYFLVARKRASGSRVGPVREGDMLAVYPGNPLEAKAGEVRRIELTAVEKVKEGDGGGTFVRTGGTLLRGTVTDAAGRPAAGLHVFAYTDRVIGHQRPAALSAPTGADGRFAVHLGEPGTYYVGARENYGDSPAPGERFGLYEATADHGLTVGAGETIDDIRIVVEEIDLN